MSIEAMEKAHEALVLAADYAEHQYMAEVFRREAMDLRKAIKRAKHKEPVAWVLLENWKSGKFWPNDCFAETSESPEMSPLYTAPTQREWVGITDNEILKLYRVVTKSAWDCFVYARVIEARLKEKNT